jgi:hypothetical protein
MNQLEMFPTVCPFCDKAIAEEPGDDECTGIQTLRVDPYVLEIYEEYQEVLMCPGEFTERALDI